VNHSFYYQRCMYDGNANLIRETLRPSFLPQTSRYPNDIAKMESPSYMPDQSYPRSKFHVPVSNETSETRTRNSDFRSNSGVSRFRDETRDETWRAAIVRLSEIIFCLRERVGINRGCALSEIIAASAAGAIRAANKLPPKKGHAHLGCPKRSDRPGRSMFARERARVSKRAYMLIYHTRV